jgi:glutathione S-transferase
MLKLYHGSSSVCSAKVRIGLAEKDIDWEGVPIDLKNGGQFDPAYLNINPNGVVPTLVEDDFKLFESSIILEYVDSLSPNNPLMPADLKQQATSKLWLLRCLEIHAAINTMTFATVGRKQILASKTPEQIAAAIAKMPNPWAASKRADIMENGLNSSHVTTDFAVLRKTFRDMQDTLKSGPWMNGKHYGIVDAAIIAYIDRLDRLALEGLWVDFDPCISDWLIRSKARPSYEVAINQFTPKAEADKMKASGQEIWPEVLDKWNAFNA